MTEEEILEAEKAISCMRDYLSLIASTTDVEKLIPLVLESWKPGVCEHLNRLICRLVFICPYEHKDFQALLLRDRIVPPAAAIRIRPDRADELKTSLTDIAAVDVPQS